MATLPPLLRKLLALSLLAAVLSAVWTHGVRAFVDTLAGYEARMTRDRELLVRYRAHAEARPPLQERLERLAAVEATQGGYIQADSPTLAAAGMQERIKRMVTPSGGSISSVRVLPARSEGGYQEIAVEVSLGGDIRAIRDVLLGVESAVPYLFVEELDLRRNTAPPRTRAGAVGTEATPEGPRLQARLRIAGYMREGGP